MRLGGAQNPHSPAICPEGAANLVSRARGYFNGAPELGEPAVQMEQRAAWWACRFNR